LTFVVEGSVLGTLLKSSSVLAKYKIPIIQKHQHELWSEYCKFDDPYYDLRKYYFVRDDTVLIYTTYKDKIHKGRVESILASGKSVGPF
jgi:hypothetical protein